MTYLDYKIQNILTYFESFNGMFHVYTGWIQ